MTPSEIFMLGWHEYQKKQQMLRLVSPYGEFDFARLTPPTEAEINKLLSDHQPVDPGPPYDQSKMKEYPIG